MGVGALGVIVQVVIAVDAGSQGIIRGHLQSAQNDQLFLHLGVLASFKGLEIDLSHRRLHLIGDAHQQCQRQCALENHFKFEASCPNRFTHIHGCNYKVKDHEGIRQYSPPIFSIPRVKNHSIAFFHEADFQHDGINPVGFQWFHRRAGRIEF